MAEEIGWGASQWGADEWGSPENEPGAVEKEIEKNDGVVESPGVYPFEKSERI